MKKATLTVDYGVHDWEIIQNENGYADFEVGGRYSFDESVSKIELDNAEIMIRVVEESSDEAVVPWQIAERNQNRWKCNLHIPCGGLYRLITIVRWNKEFWVERGTAGQAVHHFGVGDVYIIAGQSNASGTGRGVYTELPELGVHTLRNCKKWDLATNPLYDERGFHSPCISFAKRLKSKLSYPIGLIPCAYGGSMLAQWLKNENGYLYNEMITVLNKNNVKVKGMLWYQGESDAQSAKDAENYFERFERFVSDLREDLKNPELPLITFQLNRHLDEFEDNADHDRGFDIVREAQRKAAKVIDNVYIVPTVDAGKMTDGIHNSKASNVMLGERAGQLALHKIYGIGLKCEAPDIISAVFISETAVQLSFANVEDCLMAFHVGAHRLPIMVEDREGVIDIAEYYIDKNLIKLNLSRAAKGKTLIKCQYGCKPQGIIQDIGTQLPIICFSDIEVR